jgi:hypothetical protein
MNTICWLMPLVGENQQDPSLEYIWTAELTMVSLIHLTHVPAWMVRLYNPLSCSNSKILEWRPDQDFSCVDNSEKPWVRVMSVRLIYATCELQVTTNSVRPSLPGETSGVHVTAYDLSWGREDINKSVNCTFKDVNGSRFTSSRLG